MNFLESSAVLVPALTGMTLTFYDGTTNALKHFEHKYCFSPQLQKCYTAQRLEALLQQGYTVAPISQLILPGTCGQEYTIDHTGRQCPGKP